MAILVVVTTFVAVMMITPHSPGGIGVGIVVSVTVVVDMLAVSTSRSKELDAKLDNVVVKKSVVRRLYDVVVSIIEIDDDVK
jgi:hypothetical protein